MSERKGIKPSRGIEHLIYATMWILILLFPLINEIIHAERGLPFSWDRVTGWWIRAVPFMIIYLIHNYLLVEGFLLKGKIKRYALCTILLLAIFSTCQYLQHDYLRRHKELFTPHTEMPGSPPETHGHATETHHPIPHPHHVHQLPPHAPIGLPIPLLMNILLGMLILGFNLAIVLFFKYYREQEELKELHSMRMQEELKYLKVQINPHFFMNMLNNIHAMVDIDPLKSQDMILELSKLMRYVLYEGKNTMTPLANEVKFISNYVSLMSQRYHPEKVRVEMDMPSYIPETIKLPPLLFISFIENAFKHGISYLKKSDIYISLAIEGEQIHFVCRNSKAIKENSDMGGGVGLENTRRRLDLIYGKEGILEIKDENDQYIVNLIIPHR